MVAFLMSPSERISIISVIFESLGPFLLPCLVKNRIPQRVLDLSPFFSSLILAVCAGESNREVGPNFIKRRRRKSGRVRLKGKTSGATR